MVDCLGISSNLIISLLQMNVCVSTDPNEDKQDIETGVWSFFYEIGEYLHHHRFGDPVRVARHIKLIPKAKQSDCITVVKHSRLYHALYAFNLLARATSNLSIVPPGLVDKIVRLITHHIVEMAGRDMQNE